MGRNTRIIISSAVIRSPLTGDQLSSAEQCVLLLSFQDSHIQLPHHACATPKKVMHANPSAPVPSRTLITFTHGYPTPAFRTARGRTADSPARGCAEHPRVLRGTTLPAGTAPAAPGPAAARSPPCCRTARWHLLPRSRRLGRSSWLISGSTRDVRRWCWYLASRLVPAFPLLPGPRWCRGRRLQRAMPASHGHAGRAGTE